LTNNGAASADAATLARDPIILDDLLENGQGVGRIGGLVTFVTGGLPGERVRIRVDAVKRTYATAHAVAIETPSPNRVEPGCPAFPACGGCQTLHLRYEAELTWKRRLVRDALERLGGSANPEVDEVEPGIRDGAGYRNKVTLVCAGSHAHPRLGFYAARSHRLVPIDGCPVLVPRLNEAVERLVKFAANAREAMRGAERIVVRASTTGPELVACFIGRKPNDALRGALTELRREIPQLTGVLMSWEPVSENVVFGKRFATLWGDPAIRERVGGAQFTFGIASFFQINTPVLERIAQRIVEGLAGSTRVVDLYCGVGTFGVLLGRGHVASTGVEVHRGAVDEAAANAAANGVTNAAFEAATASSAVAGTRGKSLLTGADAVIVDPPRKGCEREVLDALAEALVPRIVYLSCNPATLARDAGLLRTLGYALGRVSPFDMFPHTGHVEVLAEFARTR